MNDVQKKLGNLFVHYGKMRNGNLKINENVELKIDVEKEIMLEHTTQQHIYYTSL